jgi:uncharacterized damage-inducible protein DinB
MNDLLRNLMAHMRWADGLVADALERDAPNDDEATRLFAHVASVEHLWYARIQARAAEHPVWPALGVDQARALAATHAGLFERLLVPGDESGLARRVAYTNSAGRDFQSTVADIVIHVAMHGSHHRGQIVRRLRALDHEPPYVDYIQYTRLDQLE